MNYNKADNEVWVKYKLMKVLIYFKKVTPSSVYLRKTEATSLKGSQSEGNKGP